MLEPRILTFDGHLSHLWYDANAYPRKRFHPNLLNRYKTWVANGREDLTAEELHEMFSVERSDENNTSGNTSINNDFFK